ncbi:hypothetical protein ACMBCM_08180, partial [Spiroplasma sp. K1]
GFLIWKIYILFNLSQNTTKVANYVSCLYHQRSVASYIYIYIYIYIKHAYSNAKTEDLSATLEEGPGEPVNKLINS